MVEFHKTLSDRSVQVRLLRTFGPGESNLARTVAPRVFIEYDRGMVLVDDLKRRDGQSFHLRNSILLGKF